MFMLTSFSAGKNSFLKTVNLILFHAFMFLFFSCSAQKKIQTTESVKVGAARMEMYLPLLQGKTVGLVANHTAMIGTTHLLDTLIKQNIDIAAVFSPEHGFRGTADAGAHITDGKDSKTGIPIVSLYGKNKKPSKDQLKGIEVLVFDLQDVGVRFYTYLSTLHYVLEAATENNIAVIVLDRPNPNIASIDGPVLDTAFSSFVGLHPVPILYGMTIGEYAQMIAGEQWIKTNATDAARLTIIPIANYTRTTSYVLPIAPSPNLRSAAAIAWYPTLCLFEGTEISVGRGTNNPFTLYGNPHCTMKDTAFTPTPNVGAKYPRFQDEVCYGKSMLKEQPTHNIHINEWIAAYQCYEGEKPFFNAFFKKLAGTDQLKKQLENNWTEKRIRASWKKDLKVFKYMRKAYLIYE
jgi:uncharacterized protein YbbC (DUF1343 family)